MRLLVVFMVVSMLSACSVLPFVRGSGPAIVAKSQYCGTPSQTAQLHYFSNAHTFDHWLDYRSIDDLRSAKAANGGAIVVEMGQRPTGGYAITLDRAKTGITGNTLTLDMAWNAPRLDAAVSQALIAPCVVIRPPKGQYRNIRVVDQLGNTRGQVRRGQSRRQARQG